MTRKRLLTTILAITMIFLFAAGVWANVGFLKNPEQASYSREKIREKWRKKYQFDYKPYIKGEKKLGLNPDENLYRRIYYYVTLKFVQPVDSKDLSTGIFGEVKRLLKQAKVDTADLKKVPRTENPMKELVKVYGDRVDPDLLRFAVIRGMMEGLNDPHTMLMLPEDYKRLKENMSGGNFYGIGVFIMLDPDNYNWLTVSEPIEGTPAYKAGLKPGDVVTEIDGESTKGQPIDLAVSKIRGAKGTDVVLTIKRKGESKPLKVPITRDFIHVNSVKAKLIENKIGYIKLRVYGSDTGSELEQAMKKLENKGAKAFILDLRNNSGGLIDSSVDVCSKFLPRGSAVVSVVQRGGTPKVYRTMGGNHPKFPMVVLINELSASASEITAGCLRDHGRAILIGEKSFGKGSVQELMPIRSNGGSPAALKLTIALFYTPKNTKINKVGLEPDVKVPMDLRDAGVEQYNKDKQLQKAVEYLLKKV